jgi:hypothetical protein
MAQKIEGPGPDGNSEHKSILWNVALNADDDGTDGQRKTL